MNNSNNDFLGYQSSKYAASFYDIGEPIKLKSSQGWIIKRPIPQSNLYDCMGCYPFLVCSNWEKLSSDLHELQEKLVSITVVTDPAGNYTVKTLQDIFPDLCQNFKKHYVVDLNQSWRSSISNNHRRNAKKANQQLEIESLSNPYEYLAKWSDLYNILIKRHNINGIPKFTKNAFAYQLQAPGIKAHRAIYKGKTVGMVLWYVYDTYVYYHLGAYNHIGYTTCASFAIFRQALEEFAQQGKKFVFLGAGSGITNNEDDGLTRFKRGWANSTRTVYLCGRIFQKETYTSLVQNLSKYKEFKYFPAYRDSEF